MESLDLTVVSAREVDGEVRAFVRAVSPGGTVVYLELKLTPNGIVDIWLAARNEALKFLNIA